MTNTIGIMHYASPPGVGGVEQTIYYHALGLADLGYAMKIVTGKGQSFDDRIPTVVHPLFGSVHPEVLAVKQALDQGKVPNSFAPLVEQMLAALHETLSDCDILIAHNVTTLNKSLALSVALEKFIQEQQLPLLAWCHDLAWKNQQYLPELYPDYPWEVLKNRWQHTVYVTVSEPRQAELADMLGVALDEVQVVVPGVDPAAFFFWTPTTQRLVAQLQLLDADGLLLLPARITRRKNIALGLRVLAEIRQQSGRDFRLIVTGPPGPHNPANPGYLGELLDLRDELSLQDSAHFLYAYGDPPDNDTMANLYQLADGLFFPSIQEGFGIPVLEAGFAGIPVFCSDIPPFRKTGRDNVIYFHPTDEPPASIASRVLEYLLSNDSYHLRVRVRQNSRWQSIIREQIVPLIKKGVVKNG